MACAGPRMVAAHAVLMARVARMTCAAVARSFRAAVGGRCADIPVSGAMQRMDRASSYGIAIFTECAAAPWSRASCRRVARLRKIGAALAVVRNERTSALGVARMANRFATGGVKMPGAHRGRNAHGCSDIAELGPNPDAGLRREAAASRIVEPVTSLRGRRAAGLVANALARLVGRGNAALRHRAAAGIVFDDASLMIGMVTGLC